MAAVKVTMTKALLLDFDGTLADSLGFMRAVYERFLAGHGVVGSAEEFQALNGPPLAEVVRRLRARHGLTPPFDELLRDYRGLIAAGQQALAPGAGARELLAAARERGYRVAVVTSADSAAVAAWLERRDLRPFVGAVVGGDAVTRGKPDPEPYRTALRLLGCAAERSIAIEDSPQGATAAVAAGLRTYVLRALPATPGSWPGVAGFMETLADAIGLLEG